MTTQGVLGQVQDINGSVYPGDPRTGPARALQTIVSLFRSGQVVLKEDLMGLASSSVEAEAQIRSAADVVLTSAIDSVAAEVAGMSTAIDAVEVGQAQLISSVSGLNTQVLTINGQIMTLDDSVSALVANVASVQSTSAAQGSLISALQVTDTNLQQSITQEGANRVNEDAVINTRITANENLDSAQGSDILAIQSGLTLLSANLASEITNRTNADISLSNDLSAEALVRANADNATQATLNALLAADADIMSSVLAVEGSVTTLSSGLASETSARIATDASMGSTITFLANQNLSQDTAIVAVENGLASETTARTAADAAINASLNTLRTNSNANFTVLGTNYFVKAVVFSNSMNFPSPPNYFSGASLTNYGPLTISESAGVFSLPAYTQWTLVVSLNLYGADNVNLGAPSLIAMVQTGGVYDGIFTEQALISQGQFVPKFTVDLPAPGSRTGYSIRYLGLIQGNTFALVIRPESSFTCSVIGEITAIPLRYGTLVSV